MIIIKSQKDKVYGNYDIIKGHRQLQNYHAKMAIRELKKSKKRWNDVYESHI